jgi:hypothetical protein
MILRLLVSGVLCFPWLRAEEIPRAIQVAEPPTGMKLAGQDRVVSHSLQFRITGGDPLDRSAYASLCEDAKNELLKHTSEEDAWKVPIHILLHGRRGDPMPARTSALAIFWSEVGYEIRLDVHLSRGIEQERFKYAATSALVYERTLRNRTTKESDTPFLVPPWLVDGLREATAWRLNQSDRRLYEALFKTGGLFKIDDVFAMTDRNFEEMDAAMRAAFRVSSGALVMALLQQSQGKDGFRSFLTEVASYQGEMPALLRKHFPELNLSETSLSKWWALQLANIGGQNLATDVLTIFQTEAALAEALRFNIRTEEGILLQKELNTWPELSGLTDAERVAAVRLAQDALVRLSYRCFPSYRPVIAEYQITLNALAKNQTTGLESRLTALDERRVTMKAKAVRARDYLDWFEITRARETSGAFDDYMRLKDRLKSKPHHRADPISKYLDRMDSIFDRGDQTPAPQPPTPNNFAEIPSLPALPR